MDDIDKDSIYSFMVAVDELLGNSSPDGRRIAYGILPKQARKNISWECFSHNVDHHRYMIERSGFDHAFNCADPMKEDSTFVKKHRHYVQEIEQSKKDLSFCETKEEYDRQNASFTRGKKALQAYHEEGIRFIGDDEDYQRFQETRKYRERLAK